MARVKACDSSSASKAEQKADLVLEDLELDEEPQQVQQSQEVSLSRRAGCRHGDGHARLLLQTEDAGSRSEGWSPAVKMEAEAAATLSEQRWVTRTRS